MKIRLTALTPIHIGGGESGLSPLLEFVVSGGRCYVISEDKLALALQENGKLDLFSLWFAEREQPFLRDFLRDQGLLKADFLEQISLYSSTSPAHIARELRPCIRNAFQHPFLPGTSIKGAIRTAFLYTVLKNMPEQQRQKILHDFVKDRLDEFDKDSRGQYRWFQDRFKQQFAQRLEENIFQPFSLQEGKQRFDPHTDLFRCLHVTDSTLFNIESAKIETVKIFSAYSAESPKRFSLYAECLPEGSACEFEITIDELTLAEFRKRNQRTRFGTDFSVLEEMLRDPPSVWAGMGDDLWEKDDHFFSRELKRVVEMPDRKNHSLVRLGWGAGLLGTTVDMLLPEPGQQEIRNTFFHDRGETPAPKSRRLAMRDNNTFLPLGWAKVEPIG